MIVGDIWEFLLEHARWFAMIFYWDQTAPVRDAAGWAGLFFMAIAVLVLWLRFDGKRTAGIFAAESMHTILMVGTLVAAPYVGRALIIGYGINLVQGRLSMMRFQSLDPAQIETWVPLLWGGLWALGIWMTRKVAVHDSRRWEAFRR